MCLAHAPCGASSGQIAIPSSAAWESPSFLPWCQRLKPSPVSQFRYPAWVQ